MAVQTCQTCGDAASGVEAKCLGGRDCVTFRQRLYQCRHSEPEFVRSGEFNKRTESSAKFRNRDRRSCVLQQYFFYTDIPKELELCES
jgi:hypothetical protein